MANYRLEALKSWMQNEGVELIVIEDCEERRSASLRYLSGHPSDALFFLHISGATLLVAWDMHLAEIHATADAPGLVQRVSAQPRTGNYRRSPALWPYKRSTH